MLNKLSTLWQYVVPQHLLSRLIGKLANSKNNYIKNKFIQTFIKHYRVNLADAEISDATQYANFNAFFTRKLRKETRPICDDSNIIVSPVDGSVSQVGIINNGVLFQAKRKNYSLEALLADSTSHISAFQHGHFSTIYLAPRDYHRIHLPIAGTLTKMVYVPGRLFSVNPLTTKTIPHLFSRNERVILYFSTKIGNIAIVLVGAMIVASISTPWAGIIAPGRPRKVQSWLFTDNQISLNKGDEIGKFLLGSTVIMLFPKGSINFSDTFQKNKQVKMGQSIAHIL